MCGHVTIIKAINRGWHLKRYSVIEITLRYDFALSQIAAILSRIVIASNSYSYDHIGPVIASYSYRSALTL
jgi:hypothetical protein